MEDILAIFTAEIEPILNISKFLPSLVFQPLQLAVISNFKKNGGNCLGIDESDGPVISEDHPKNFLLGSECRLTRNSHGHQLHLG